MSENLKKIKLKNRTLLELKGDESREFLQSLVTNNINLISKEKSIYSALLSPQGKYLYDFFIFQNHNNNIVIDCEKNDHEKLIQKLNIYKLRSKIEIVVNDKIDIYSIYGQDIDFLISNLKLKYKEGFTKEVSDNLFFVDPRNKNLGIRNYSKKLLEEFNKIPSGILSEWHYVRIKNNIPYPYNDLEKEKSFIIENNFEKINAIDFNKGCYIGQENTARQKYRGTAKRQLVVGKILGKEILNGEKVFYDKKMVGTVRSSSKELCLVNIRSEIYEKCKKNKTSIKIKESELIFI
tara:strand:- start:187 stop:1065 length:879 start_codon:yes stop_codon:yes gene_type:complete